MTSLPTRLLLLAALLALPAACRSTPEQPAATPAAGEGEAGPAEAAGPAGAAPTAGGSDDAPGVTATERALSRADSGPEHDRQPGLLEPGEDALPARDAEADAAAGDVATATERGAPPARDGADAARHPLGGEPPRAPETASVGDGAPTVDGALLGAGATAGEPGEGDGRAEGTWAQHPARAAADKPAYAAWARERADRLDRALAGIRDVTTDAFRAEREELAAAVGELAVPLVLSARDRHLRAWHAEERRQYQEAVGALYDETQATLEQLLERAGEEAVRRARAMATERSPLDAGPSGEPLLDRELFVFEETLRDALNFPEFDAQRQLDLLGRLELVEAASSFTSPGADARLGGRLLLYVGGPELSPGPLVRVVLRVAEDVDARDRFVYQVARYRVMRGDTLVQDLGWRPMPPGDGWADLELHADRYLIASGLSPALDPSAPAFGQLRDMRVVVDLQTAVLSTEPPPALGSDAVTTVVDDAGGASGGALPGPARVNGNDAPAEAPPVSAEQARVAAASPPPGRERGAIIAGPDVSAYGPPQPLPARPPEHASLHVLGGMNWRIEFRITFRGVVSWQIAAAAPVFDAECRKVREQLER